MKETTESVTVSSNSTTIIINVDNGNMSTNTSLETTTTSTAIDNATSITTNGKSSLIPVSTTTSVVITTLEETTSNIYIPSGERVKEEGLHLRMLLITANVGTLFEHPAMISGWCTEVIKTIIKCRPNFVSFAFQELGGKDSAFLNNLDTFCADFFDIIVQHDEQEDRFYSSGIIFDNDLRSPNFTAMGNVVLARQSIATHLSIWDFTEQKFHPFQNCNHDQSPVCSASDSSFVYHGRFKGTKSRKGYLKTKWKFNEHEFDLVNVHLYHDDLNTTAISNIPSIYASERAKALSELVDRCSISNHIPAFLFGDFNIRLDGDFIEWIKLEYQSKSIDLIDPLVVVKEKDFFFKYSTELFNNPNLRQQVLQFDREIQRFNDTQDSVKLCELAINFGPTYCLDTKDVRKNGKDPIYASKRIPAWCDRVMFTEAAQRILHRSEYHSINGDHSTGDHTPVYFFASFSPV